MTDNITLYHEKDLKELSAILSNYYNDLERFSNDAGVQAINMLNEQLSHGEADCLNRCISFLKKLTAFTRDRKEVYLPYLEELFEKRSTGHNCAVCSGKCDMQHTMKLLGLNASRKEMRGAAEKNRTDLAELLNINSLCDAIKQIDKTLNEILYLEENSLIPKIIEAQKDIHVHS